jgi:excisionase family DNA binding protein
MERENVVIAEQTSTPDRLMYPVPEAGRRLGISRSVVYELIAAGAIHSVTIGRRRLIPEASLVEYVDGLRAAQR